ncbi:hypothetical protein [Actinokineospora pegani]|uniref:hypothetical protein n=1 Tax=Actinokineospora pegani TaxID=2654637 RepID=UPI0012EA2EFD|nr:hypothetical protein [Actinokineospora pegani]
MAGQPVMSTPIFDELLREMRGSAVEEKVEESAEDKAEQPAPAATQAVGTPAPKAKPGSGGRRRKD